MEAELFFCDINRKSMYEKVDVILMLFRKRKRKICTSRQNQWKRKNSSFSIVWKAFMNSAPSFLMKTTSAFSTPQFTPSAWTTDLESANSSWANSPDSLTTKKWNLSKPTRLCNQTKSATFTVLLKTSIYRISLTHSELLKIFFWTKPKGTMNPFWTLIVVSLGRSFQKMKGEFLVTDSLVQIICLYLRRGKRV